jgi:hypothetical protein
MMELIDKKQLLKDLAGMYDVLTGAGDPFLASMIRKAMECVERQPVVTGSDRRSGDVKQDHRNSGEHPAGG